MIMFSFHLVSVLGSDSIYYDSLCESRECKLQAILPADLNVFRVSSVYIYSLSGPLYKPYATCHLTLVDLGLTTAAGRKTNYKECVGCLCMCMAEAQSKRKLKKTYFSWKALLVPLWSKSWHTQPTISAKISTSVRVSWKPAVWLAQRRRGQWENMNTQYEPYSRISYSHIIWNCEEYIK